MKTFKDSEDREWQIAMTIDECERVEGLIEVDLLKPSEPRGDVEDAGGTLVDSLDSDFGLFAKVVFALVSLQAEAKKVDEKAFKKALDGSAMASARKAFWGEMADFFQSHPRIVAILEQRAEMGKEVYKKILAETVQEQITAMKTSGTGSTTSPGSSESIPGL